MKMQNIPAFGEKDFFEDQANADVRVWAIRSASHLFENTVPCTEKTGVCRTADACFYIYVRAFIAVVRVRC